MKTKRIAIVTQDLRRKGGLFTAAAFLHRVLRGREDYHVDLVSLAMSSRDECSRLLRSPRTWAAQPTIARMQYEGLSIQHVGASWGEIEFQRYRPRSVLTSLLNSYDIVQFVAGYAAWANCARGVRPPVCIWPASTFAADRASRMRQAPVMRRLWAAVTDPVIERIERRALNGAAAVFALSKYTSASIAAHVPAGRLHLAPCGIDTEFYRPKPERARRYIFAAGRLWDPRKNVRLLLRAYAMLRSRMPTAPELWLAGNDAQPACIDLIASLGLTGHVRLLGECSNEQLLQYYQGALCFVLSSDEEGLGIVVLEAMGCATPVISTRCGGPETIVEDGRNGFLTPVGAVEPMAAALERLLTDPELWRRMAAAGRRTVEEKFSLEVASRPFTAVYGNLVVAGDSGAHARGFASRPMRTNCSEASS